MYTLLKDIMCTPSISGRENTVADKLKKYITPYVDECYKDALGNLIAVKKGSGNDNKKIMLCAHMDEIGFLVTYIEESGYIRTAPVGGINYIAASFSEVVSENGVRGVLVPEAGTSAADINGEKTCIDIGAKNKEEAQKYVRIGDSVHFKSDYVEFGNDKIKAKAIDDRFGCAVMLKMIEDDLEYDTYFAFLVQEEVGCRGGGPAVFSVRPDYAVVLEATTASDIAFVSDENRVCVQGEGAVVSFMDRSTVYNPDLFRGAFDIAERERIKIQPKTTVAGGNDAGTIHKSCEGVYTVAVSLPCRYIHSGTCVADKKDMIECYRLAKALGEEYANA